MNKFIDLNELERRIEVWNKPTPQDVLNMIRQMKDEIKEKCDEV